MKLKDKLSHEFDSLFGNRFLSLTGTNKYESLKNKILQWTISKQVEVGVMRKFNGRIYYRVYWYKELNLKREEHFTTKEAAIIKYTEIGKDYLYAGIEEIKEQTKLLGYLHSGIEQIEISA